MARQKLFFAFAGSYRAHVPVSSGVRKDSWAACLVLPRTYDPATQLWGNLYNSLLEYVISAALIFYVLTVAGDSSACDSSGLTRIGLIAHSDIQSCRASIFAASADSLRPFRLRPATTWPGLSSLYWGFPSTLCCGAGRVGRRRPVNVTDLHRTPRWLATPTAFEYYVAEIFGRSCGAISINQLLGFERSQEVCCASCLL